MPPDEPNTQPAPGQKLPAANEFSPGQVDLRQVLDIVHKHAGDRAAILEALVEEYFQATAPKKSGAARLKQQETRAGNVLIGAAQYGLVDLSASRLTPLGEELRLSPDPEPHEKLAAHILRNLGGLDVLEAVEVISARGDRVTKTSLHAELELRGYTLPRATTHHTKLINWLQSAGVVAKKGYQIDEQRVANFAGISLDALHGWDALTAEQQAFLRGLAHLSDVHGEDPLPTKEVLAHVETEHGPIFKRPDQLRKQVFKPLEDAGWVELSPASKGRGGKSGMVAATEQLLKVDLGLVPTGSSDGIPPDLRPHLKKPLPEIYDALVGKSTYDKGVALELLAIRMAVDLTLTPIRLRERAKSTGDAEVDLIAEAAHLHFSRWLLQCKNVKKVSVSALAKEVGMAVLLKAQVVVIVTTGEFSASVKAYARELGSSTNLQAVLVDKKVLAAYQASGPTALRAFFNDGARATLLSKRGQLGD